MIRALGLIPRSAPSYVSLCTPLPYLGGKKGVEHLVSQYYYHERDARALEPVRFSYSSLLSSNFSTRETSVNCPDIFLEGSKSMTCMRGYKALNHEGRVEAHEP